MRRLRPTSGTCKGCGEDWSDGCRDEPSYSNCTCEGEAEPEQDEDEARAEAEYRELNRGEL